MAKATTTLQEAGNALDAIPDITDRTSPIPKTVKQQTQENFNKFDAAIQRLLQAYNVDSIDNITNYDIKRSCKSLIPIALTKAITNGEVDLAFKSESFKLAQTYNPAIAGEILAESLGNILSCDKNTERTAELLKSPAFQKELGKLEKSKISAMAEFIGKLIINPSKHYELSGFDSKLFINLLLENKPFKKTLNSWANTPIGDRETITVRNPSTDNYQDVGQPIQEFINNQKIHVRLEEERQAAKERKERLKAMSGTLSFGDAMEKAKAKKNEVPQK